MTRVWSPPKPPHVVALAMDDYLDHTRTDWTVARLTARAKRLWGKGVWPAKGPVGYALLTAHEYDRWRRGTRKEDHANLMRLADQTQRPPEPSPTYPGGQE